MTGVVCACCATPLDVLWSQAALPLRRSTYEQRWQQFEAWPAGKPISFKDVPWPCASPGAQAAAHKQEHQQQVLQLDPKQLQTLVLAGRALWWLLCTASEIVLGRPLRCVGAKSCLQTASLSCSKQPSAVSAQRTSMGLIGLFRGFYETVLQKPSVCKSLPTRVQSVWCAAAKRASDMGRALRQGHALSFKTVICMLHRCCWYM
jgi:hypothetical protein